jgi:ABC-2 type transport system permease protein
MLHLLKIEWLKIRKYRAFWVLAGAFTLLFPITFYFVGDAYMKEVSQQSAEANMINALVGQPFVFPKVWHTSAWFGGLFFVILGMLFILLITNEVQYRTHRQNIIDGWSRTEFILAKFYVMLCMVLLSTILVIISGLVVGLIHTPAASSAGIFDGFYYVGYFAVMAVHYLAVAFITAILVKRTGLTIIIYFVLVLIVDNLLWVLFTYRNTQFGFYFLMEPSDSLLPHPFMPKPMVKRTVSDISLLLTSIGYIVLFGYLLLTSFRKSDLKT